MRNSLLTDLLSLGINLIGENNGKYTFYTEVSFEYSGYSIKCPPLFDKTIPVGSVLIVKITRKTGGTSYIELAVLVCCNASSNIASISLRKNNLTWRDLTNVGFSIIPK